MASGDPESGKSAGGVEEYDKDPKQGGVEAVVQFVLLFVAETWVVNPLTRQVLGDLQDQVARQLTVWLLRQRVDGK